MSDYTHSKAMRACEARYLTPPEPYDHLEDCPTWQDDDALCTCEDAIRGAEEFAAERLAEEREDR